MTVRDFTNLQWQRPSRSKGRSTSMRGYVIARAQIALIWLATLCTFTPTLATAAEAPVNILFVGNSFTHGRYEPVRTYNAGFGTDTVHDLLCPSLAACSSAEQVARSIRPRRPRPAPPCRHNWPICRPILPCNTTSPAPMAGYQEFSYSSHARHTSIIQSPWLR
jgi:hypothetical protein